MPGPGTETPNQLSTSRQKHPQPLAQPADPELCLTHANAFDARASARGPLPLSIDTASIVLCTAAQSCGAVERSSAACGVKTASWSTRSLVAMMLIRVSEVREASTESQGLRRIAGPGVAASFLGRVVGEEGADFVEMEIDGWRKGSSRVAVTGLMGKRPLARPGQPGQGSRTVFCQAAVVGGGFAAMVLVRCKTNLLRDIAND